MEFSLRESFLYFKRTTCITARPDAPHIRLHAYLPVNSDSFLFSIQLVFHSCSNILNEYRDSLSHSVAYNLMGRLKFF